MSNLRVKQIKSRLLAMFEEHLPLADISKTDKQRQIKVLTRCLAAFAIYNLAGCSEIEAAQAVWDGSDDNGIDAAFHDTSDSRVVIVQSKWIEAGSGEPEAKDIAVFANGIKDLIEQDDANFNPRLAAKLAEISPAIMSPGTTVHIVVISTGASQISKHGTAALDRLISELNGADDPIATKEIIGLAQIYPALAANSAQDKITLDANILEWSHISQPYAAYFGVIDGLQLKSWWSTYGKRLVAKNIRHALGATDVNHQIRLTATGSPENFWYFNNGITLIADEAPRAPQAAGSRASGVFQLRGASIVNGAQTVSTLARIESDDALGRVRVPIRVILLRGTPDKFGSEVTRTNNLQNRVEARDFVAQDPQQSRLQMEMGMEGIEYQFLRSEDFIASPNACDLVEVTTALACASGDSNHAVAVKTGIGRFFNDLKKPPYIALYNPDLSGARAFNTTLTQRAIDKWIDAKKKTFSKKSGPSWGVLIHGNRILAASVFRRMEAKPLSVPITEYRKSLKQEEINGFCEQTYNKMIKAIEKQYPGKFLAVLFKSPSASKAIFDTASKAK
jgi:hypothetical protein